LAARVDEHLGRMNLEYCERLESGRLRRLVVKAVPEGAWEMFRDKQLARGGTLEQYKHPCLSNDLEFPERLRAMIASPRQPDWAHGRSAHAPATAQ
jgi:hypothetical protein